MINRLALVAIVMNGGRFDVAKCVVKMPEEFLLKVSKLGKNTDTIVEKVLKSGAEIVKENVKTCLEEVIGQDTVIESRTTGELLSSLGISPTDINNKGEHNLKIGFNEPRRKQYAAKGKRSYYEITNAMIANVIEYGKSGQSPKPFLKRAKNKSRKPALEAMKRKLNEEIEKL